MEYSYWQGRRNSICLLLAYKRGDLMFSMLLWRCMCVLHVGMSKTAWVLKIFKNVPVTWEFPPPIFGNISITIIWIIIILSDSVSKVTCIHASGCLSVNRCPLTPNIEVQRHKSISRWRATHLMEGAWRSEGEGWRGAGVLPFKVTQRAYRCEPQLAPDTAPSLNNTNKTRHSTEPSVS